MVEQAAGGLWTNPSDLAKFVIEMQLSLQGMSNKVLSKEMTQTMLTTVKDRVGPGVFIDDINGSKYFQHSADNQGFSGKYFASFEGGQGVVIFINGDAGQQIIDELQNSVADVYKWKGIYTGELIDKEEINLPGNIANQYEGIYSDGQGMIHIFRKDSALWLQASPVPYKMHFTSNDSFFNLESKAEKYFVYEDGKLKGFARTIDGRKVGFANKLKTAKLTDDQQNKYEGTYRDDAGEAAKVRLIDNELWLDAGGVKEQLFFTSDEDFIILEDGPVRYKMIINSLGEVTGILRQDGDQRMIIERVK
jgi:hypothetical protein